jgi:glucokinase
MTQHVIGIDLGGTKCAAGLMQFPEGIVLARRLQPTEPGRGSAIVLADVVELAVSLQQQAAKMDVAPTAIGLGIAELVGVDGQVLSGATINLQGTDIEESLRAATGLRVHVEADVRAAARCEAHFGAGRAFRSFLYITVGTGISASLVVGGVPYAGARGLTGTFASSRGLVPADDGSLVSGPPLERFAAGPALAARLNLARPSFAGTAPDVLSLAEAADPLALAVVTSAGVALGAAIGQLINVLDPEAVIVGGGLGLATGHYHSSMATAMRTYIWSDLHRDIPLLSAEMGNDAGFIGAALAASCQ